MNDQITLLIVGIYILLILCLIFFFTMAVRIRRLGNKITEFESAYKKEISNMDKQVEQIKTNIDKTKALFK